MSWIKSNEFGKDEMLTLIELGLKLDNTYIITRYKAEKQGIILLATSIDSLIEMIDDTVPEDAIFEVWTKEIEGGDPNEPRSFS